MEDRIAFEMELMIRELDDKIEEQRGLLKLTNDEDILYHVKTVLRRLERRKEMLSRCAGMHYRRLDNLD